MLIHAEHLLKKYHDKVILDIDTLNIEKGRIYGFVGENGAGKLCGQLFQTRLINPMVIRAGRNYAILMKY